MNVREHLRQGHVIPAHPLALTAARRLDERRQRALTRYYLAAGVGGSAIGVHTTQFAIRERRFSLYEPVLQLAMDEMKSRPVVKIAGVCGGTEQASHEAEFAASLGYDAVLLSLGALRHASIEQLLAHARAVAGIVPVIGFYLQPSVGGILLPYKFWREFCEIPNVIAVKIAPFNRYQTLDVVRAVSESGRARDIALYTGNDDNIVVDLLTIFDFGGESASIVGGLLGHWAVWTHTAVRTVTCLKSHRGADIPASVLTLAQQITDANAALFDPVHDFRGSIPGIHEILRRQGLLAGRWCLDPNEDLSPGQEEEIDRVCRSYPHLQDNAFVAEHLDEWLR
ncbi:MAG: dihydrodipicolinate synthase family protein [Acidobacteriaceae bacterium]|nr:dihydrodipicolinate synthase family protein [Acidobacteriaceae bacterium]